MRETGKNPGSCQITISLFLGGIHIYAILFTAYLQMLPKISPILLEMVPSSLLVRKGKSYHILAKSGRQSRFRQVPKAVSPSRESGSHPGEPSLNNMAYVKILIHIHKKSCIPGEV